MVSSHGSTIIVLLCVLLSDCNSSSLLESSTFIPGYHTNGTVRQNCKLFPAVSGLHKKVKDMLSRELKLLEYDISVDNYTINPLTVNTTWNYKLNLWARVAHSHGQTILSLAFNYGILSLMTLSFGVVTLPVKVRDEPVGCLGKLKEDEKALAVLELLMRDFKIRGQATVNEGESVCHRILKKESDKVKFSNKCCFKKIEDGDLVCTTDMPNFWLNILNALMAAFTLGVFLIGPIMTPSWLYSAALDTEKYVVKLKEPLYKTMCVCCGDGNIEVIADNTIDIRYADEFLNCRSLAAGLPLDTVIPIKISQFDISVNYAKLVPENKVPVGMWESITRAVFLCKLRTIGPFQDCCESNIYGCYRADKPVPWLGLCKLIGRISMVVFLPIPFYIRLVLYYLFENPEINNRYKAVTATGLQIWYDHKLLQYLTPLNPLFLAVYIIYFTSGFTFAYVSLGKRRSRIHQIIIDAYRELVDLSWLSPLGMLVGNTVWPFTKFGIFGCLIGLIYWPIVMPISLVACAFYSLPLVFLTCRIFVLSFTGKTLVQKELDLPGQLKRGLGAFEADKLIEKIGAKKDKISLAHRVKRFCRTKTLLRHSRNFLVALVCNLTLYSIMIMFAECFSFVLHVGVFTMMGIIVNASKVLKYGSLIFLVIFYSYDCYNNVYKKYLKLNKSLFSEIKHRIKEVDEVTSLPSYLQQNQGFKAAEASEQAEYESEDALSQDFNHHWNINDLILFIDNDDTPRIPRKLFDDACTIQVAGSPGPVYRSLLSATGKFLMIIMFVVFVFMVVLTFGDVYRVSSTNQMLATMAGGFMPMIFSKILRPAFPDLELGSVSFKGKLEEIIKNFVQPWPMHDFVFEVEEKPEEDSDGDSDNSDSDKKKKEKEKSKKDKKKTSPMRSSMEVLDGNGAVENNFEDDIKVKLNEMKSVKPAAGQFVDILVILPDETNNDEWLLEWSDIGEYEDDEVIGNEMKHFNKFNGSNNTDSKDFTMDNLMNKI